MLLLMLPGDNSETGGGLRTDTCQGKRQASAQHGLQVHCGEGHPSVADSLNQDLLGLQVQVSKTEVWAPYAVCLAWRTALSSAATWWREIKELMESTVRKEKENKKGKMSVSLNICPSVEMMWCLVIEFSLKINWDVIWALPKCNMQKVQEELGQSSEGERERSADWLRLGLRLLRLLGNAS